MHPVEPLLSSAPFIYDRSHFVTKAGVYNEDDFAGITVERIEDLSDRYVGEPGFTPADIEIDLWRVVGDEPVLKVIEALRSAEFDARPVYCFGFEGHWSLEPGSEAASRRPLPDTAVAPATPPEAGVGVSGSNLLAGSADAVHVAVVDAGFSPTLPPSMSGSPYGEIDDNQAKDVHGTMVLGLVELAAPHARIDYFAVEQLNADNIEVLIPAHWKRQPNLASALELYCSDDMAVAAAMIQVGNAMSAAGGDRMRFLNLSLGTYLPESFAAGGSDWSLAPLAIELALEIAAEHDVTVVAAAGNDIRQSVVGAAAGPVFYPACRRDVIAVGAIDCLGDPIMWHHGDRFYKRQEWWDYTAPGIDLIGAPYEQGERHIEGLCWSGSSFAAAVATGYFAAGGPIDDIAYGDVDGLTYLCVQTTSTSGGGGVCS